ncbi:MAG: hypothetical protein IBX67_06655 [Dehalococcoidia bacterium]|nr:hypothetical protein [Dehalococcoidia bacterium]
MADNQKRILDMLADSKIDVEEASRLLSALQTEGSAPEDAGEVRTKAKPRYLRVTVGPGPGHEHDDEAEHVKVRLPMSLIRSGIRLSSLLPEGARDKVDDALHEKGIDLGMRNLKPEELDELIEALGELEVDVASDKEVVKVFVE